MKPERMAKPGFWAAAGRMLALVFVFAVLSAGFGAVPALSQGILPAPARQVPTPPPDAAAPTQSNAIVHSGSITDEHYRLGMGDKLRITVYGEADLSGEFVVDSAGQIQLPLVGQVKAAGLTIHEFVAEVMESLGNYLKDPKVSIEVLNYRPFYIMGEVNKPGEYPYENGLSVMSAIALAGGYTYRADDTEVFIRHTGEKKEEVLRADAATKIKPGDIIRIPERIF
jgi:protein involved in polysaccharide export with SLBB domain